MLLDYLSQEVLCDYCEQNMDRFSTGNQEQNGNRSLFLRFQEWLADIGKPLPGLNMGGLKEVRYHRPIRSKQCSESVLPNSPLISSLFFILTILTFIFTITCMQLVNEVAMKLVNDFWLQRLTGWLYGNQGQTPHWLQRNRNFICSVKAECCTALARGFDEQNCHCGIVWHRTILELLNYSIQFNRYDGSESAEIIFSLVSSNNMSIWVTFSK